MEVLTTSLDKFYKLLHEKNKKIPEPVLGKVAVAVSDLKIFRIALIRPTCQ